jgi:hypothetical protein
VMENKYLETKGKDNTIMFYNIQQSSLSDYM